MIKQRISTSWGVFWLLGCSRRAPSAAYGCWRLLAHEWCIAARNQTFASYLSLKLSVLPLHADLNSLKKFLSSPIMPCSRAFRVNVSLPMSDCTVVGSSTDRMDPEVLTANGQVPHDEACRSLRTSTIFGRLPLQAQATGETHVALPRPSWKRKPFQILLFELVAKNVHLVAMMRLVFGF